MSGRSIAAWGAVTVLLGITAAGCSSSDSSGFRARNSAEVPRCMSVNKPLDQMALQVNVADRACAVGLNDLSPSFFPLEDSTSSVFDGTRLTHPGITVRLANGQFEHAFEARNQANEPVEYVRATGDASDISTLSLDYYGVTKVDESGSCLAPTLTAESIGFSGASCTDITRYAFTFVATNPQNTFNYATSSFNEWTLPNAMVAVVQSAVTVTAFNGSDPVSRMSINRSSEVDFDVKFFSYSQPSNVKPNAPIETASPGDDVPPAAGEPTDNTTQATPEPAEQPNASVGAAEVIEKHCSSIQNAFINPRPSEWSESKRFTIDVSNSCMKNAIGVSGERLYTVTLKLQATNASTNKKVTFVGAGDPDSIVRFMGRLPVGTWRVVLTQTTTEQASRDRRTEAVSQTIRVAADPSAPWDMCTAEDIMFDGVGFLLDCEFFRANIEYLTTDPSFLTLWLDNRGPTSLVRFRDGWQYVMVTADIDGYTWSMRTLLCATNCGNLPEGLPFQQVREGNRMQMLVTSDDCLSVDQPLQMFGLTRVDDRRFHFLDFNPTQDVLSFSPEELVQFEVVDGLTHVLLINGAPEFRPQCLDRDQLSLLTASIVELPAQDAPITSELPTPPPSPETTIPLPAPVVDIEFTLDDSQGTPVPVESSQESLVIEPSNIPPEVFAADSDVTKVEVADPDGTWIEVGRSLSTIVPIDKVSKELKVKYTFDDGSQATVTKPLLTVEAADVTPTTESDEPGSSFPARVILLALVGIVLAAGSVTIVRRRA